MSVAETKDNAMDRFVAAVSELTGFKSPKRALFRCRQTYRSVKLKGKRVLEIGAGAGVFSAYAAVTGASRVVALEPELAGSTAGYTAHIHHMRDALGMSGFEALPLTFQDYNPGDEKFDVVLSVNSINHLDEPMCERLLHDEEARRVYRGLFEKLSRLCSAGASIIIEDVSPGNFWHRLGLRGPVSKTIDWRKHQTPKVWAKLMEEVGFVNQCLHWRKYWPLRYFGPFAANRLIAHCLGSHFRLVMRTPADMPSEPRTTT